MTFKYLFLTDQEGNVVYSVEDKETFEVSNLIDRSYIKEALNGTQKMVRTASTALLVNENCSSFGFSSIQGWNVRFNNWND
ncbi:hypothetical protein KHA80_20100 [Anaerobacillus sp. HL2]|nr:hypothetical protein KHA80_20100 [Anaerobacillus sp. HL2]